MKNSAVAGLGTTVALGVHLGWIRPRIFRWGATSDEASRPMVGDDRCPRPQLNATRAVTIAAATGLSNWEIAQQLYLSHRTVGSHLYRIFPKLGIRSRAELAAILNTQTVPGT